MAVPAAAGSETVIGRENQLPGSSAWHLDNAARNHEITGYASRVSAAAGERVQLKINVDTPKSVHFELYRMGYYQGLGARFVTSGEPRMITPQAECAVEPARGLVECDWASAFEVTIDPSWVSGQYLFKLIADDGHDAYIALVVRESERRAPVIFQAAVDTWQAYNSFGGTSLYHNNLPKEVGFTAKHADAVSFNRPYDCGNEHDDPTCLAVWDLGEHWMSFWLEERGVEMAYLTNLDIDADPSVLLHRRLFLSVGHDEYWPLGERDGLEAARAAGVSLGFFAANTGYWRVRIEASTRGEPRRTIVCYKDAAHDPVAGARNTTVEYRNDPQARPEHALVGVMYDDDISRTYFDGFAQVVRQQDHWVYEGTGVQNGDVLGHVIGYEWDHAFANSLMPKGLEIVAHAELVNIYGAALPSDVVVYYPTASSLVFAVGSIRWASGLARPGYIDARIERMTENVLQRAGIAGFDVTQVPARSDSNPTQITSLAGSGDAGSADGPVATAQLGAPAGIAVGPRGEIYVADAAMSAIRVISPGGKVSTLAGCGAHRLQDGNGTQACFNRPTGLALAADGTLYVSDTYAHAIRAISRTGEVTTFAGTGKSGNSDGSDLSAARFSYPRGLAFGKNQELYVADGGNGSIRKIDASGVTTVVSVLLPTGVAVGPDGSLYIVDTRAGTIVQYKGGMLSTLAGAAGSFGDEDAHAEDARLRPAEGIAVDSTRLVFADGANHKVRALSLTDGTVTTLAGADGTTHDLEMPRGLVVTPEGVVVADSGHHRIVRLPAAAKAPQPANK